MSAPRSAGYNQTDDELTVVTSHPSVAVSFCVSGVSGTDVYAFTNCTVGRKVCDLAGCSSPCFSPGGHFFISVSGAHVAVIEAATGHCLVCNPAGIAWGRVRAEQWANVVACQAVWAGKRSSQVHAAAVRRMGDSLGTSHPAVLSRMLAF